MTDPTEMLKGAFASTTRAYAAALEQGVKIGGRDMRCKLYPIIRELCDMLDNSVSCDGPDREEAEELIGRAGRLLEDTAPGTAVSEAAE